MDKKKSESLDESGFGFGTVFAVMICILAYNNVLAPLYWIFAFIGSIKMIMHLVKLNKRETDGAKGIATMACFCALCEFGHNEFLFWTMIVFSFFYAVSFCIESCNQDDEEIYSKAKGEES